MCSGQMLNLDDFDKVKIEDLARGLATTFRYSGQNTHMITVASHSRLVALLVSAVWPSAYNLQLYALLHDIEEALTGDIPTGVKAHLDTDFDPFRRPNQEVSIGLKDNLIKLRLHLQVCLTGDNVVTLPVEDQQLIDEMDQIALYIEALLDKSTTMVELCKLNGTVALAEFYFDKYCIMRDYISKWNNHVLELQTAPLKYVQIHETNTFLNMYKDLTQRVENEFFSN